MKKEESMLDFIHDCGIRFFFFFFKKPIWTVFRDHMCAFIFTWKSKSGVRTELQALSVEHKLWSQLILYICIYISLSNSSAHLSIHIYSWSILPWLYCNKELERWALEFESDAHGQLDSTSSNVKPPAAIYFYSIRSVIWSSLKHDMKCNWLIVMNTTEGENL